MPKALRTDVRGGRTSVFGRRAVRTTLATGLSVLAATLFSTSSALAASAPAGFAGVGDWKWPTTAQSAQLKTDGVGAVRVGLAWDWVEHNQGARQWGGVDKLVQDASSGGYELVLVVNGCTVWACGATRTAPTTDAANAAFQSFVGDAARRYGAGGSYWAGKPALSPIKISWQIWNEVNVGADWPNPTTAGYAALLNQTSATIKGIDPAANVVSAGLAELPAVPSGAPLSTFLAGLEQQPGFKQAADVVAVHGYANNPAGTFRILDMTRRIMDAAGDSRPIWVSEFGWGSGGPAHPFAVDAATQAAYLQQTYDTMVGCRDRWHLSRAIWFALQDVTAAQLGEGDYWGMHTGLYGTDGAAKPAQGAFVAYTGGHEIPNGGGSSCPLPGGASPAAAAAATAPPTVTIVRSPGYAGATGPAQVDFVTSMGNTGHAECSLNGGDWSTCSTPYAIPRDREGSATLAIRAVDDSGTPSTTPAAVKWTVDLTAPQTVFEKKPPKRSTKRAVSMRFGVRGSRLALGASTEVVTYQCSLNKGPWKSCSAKYRAKARRTGKQVLRVRAVDQAGNVDQRGATAKFTILKK